METRNNKHIDLTYLQELADGSEEFILEMITVFIEETPKEINNLEKHLEANNWKALQATAHKMKASLSIMGINELVSCVKFIEKYAENEENLNLLPDMIAMVKNTCLEAIIELENEKQFYLH